LIPVKLPENNEEFGNLVEDTVKDLWTLDLNAVIQLQCS
jgi:hypothetical protein